MTASIDLGSARIAPEGPITAGEYVTITYTYIAGHPIDDSGYLKVVFRHVGDFGVPQFNDPDAPNYCSIRTSGACRIEPRWDPKGHTRPWSYALYLKVRGGFLDRGETIDVTFGDTSGGSPGWRAQTFCEETFEFRTLVDPIATYQFKELETSPTMAIGPGAPTRAVCIAPSQAVVGKPLSVAFKLEDRWGNPTAPVRRIEHAGFTAPGVQTIEARDEATGLSARSNPIEVTEKPLERGRYWADFHGQSEETIGSNTIRDYYAFARDAACLDIAAHQGNDFQVTDEFWSEIERVANDYYEPGQLVTFAGYEWSGNTPLGGDRNVYFAKDGGRIARSCRDLLPEKRSAYEDAPTADALFASLRGQADAEPFAFAHVGGRYADMRMHDEMIELAVEIHSAWGTFEWLLEDALSLGYRVGVCANSDGHKGRPGASYPGASTFGSYGGLTCVRSAELTRESVLEALRLRHTMATTGHRPLLDLELLTDDGRRALAGDVVDLSADDLPTLHLRFVGTAPIESITIRNGLETIAVVRPYTTADLGRRIRIVWGGAEVRGRDRKVEWHGGLRVRDNEILDVVPINVWNPEAPIERVGADRVRWRSITTGGFTGAILTLADERTGTIELETTQGEFSCGIETIGIDPSGCSYGGLKKRLEISRLPDVPGTCSIDDRRRLDRLRVGDNPIYARVVQEDGHIAWTSPIYVAVGG